MSIVDLDARRRPTAGNVPADRWRPSRAGILNVARYMRETFTFRDGWLELIGPNGSGKSMAVELLFPFLFDADLSSRRLSTFGKADRPMRDRLVGARTGITTSSRTGFLWAEFHRSEDQYFTVGARLYASTNSKNVDVTYFTTDRRITADDSPVRDGLRLLTAADTPLTVAALKDALGEDGHVHPTATAYRKAVRERLFAGLNADRYHALIGAMLELRRPKLSENLSDEHVSTLLTAALPGLDEAKVGQLATSFAELQRHEDEVSRLESHVREVRQLRDRQRIYARRVLNRAATDTISARSQRDDARRTQRTADTELEQVEKSISTTEGEHSKVAAELVLTRTEHRTTIHSSAYTEAQQLAALDEQARDAEQRAERSEAQVKEQTEIVAAANTRVEEARALAGQHRTESERLFDDQVVPAARDLGLLDEIRGARDLPVLQSQGRVSSLLERRGDQIAAVKDLLTDLDTAVERRDRLADDLEQAQTKHDEAVATAEQAADALDQAAADQQAAIGRWAANHTPTLRLDGLVDTLTAMVDSDPVASRDRIEKIVTRRRDEATGTLDADLARIETDLGRLSADRNELQEEHDRLQRDGEDDRDLAPATPAWRTADRDGRPGWPLWRTLAFHPDTDDQRRANVEAALEASGLLDAWLHPDGRLRTLDGHDLQVAASPTLTNEPAGTLLAVLQPEDDHPDAALVVGVLASIAYGDTTSDLDTTAAIGSDGSFRVGRFHGTSDKPAAELIGIAARQRTRAARIRALQHHVEKTTAQIAELEERAAKQRAHRKTVINEAQTVPPFTSMYEGHHELDRAERAVADRRAALDDLSDRHRIAEDQVRTVQRELADVAAQTRLPTDPEQLQKSELALRALSNAGQRWSNARTQAEAAEGTAKVHGEAAQREASRLQQLEATAQTDATAAANSCRAAETARRNAGDDILTITTKVQGLEERIDRLEQDVKGLSDTIGDLRERRGRLEGKAQEAAKAYEERQQLLDTHYQRLADLHRQGLVTEADIEGVPLASGGLGPDHATATLELARAVTEALSTMPPQQYDHANIERAHSNVADTLHEVARTLVGRVELTHVFQEDSDHWSIEATFEQQTMNATGLHDAMQHALDDERRLLKDHERRVLEQTLTGSLRSHVAAQLRLARNLVEEISTLLATVQTASGMQVTLKWRTRPDLPPTVKRARELLKYDLARLEDRDRQALFDFFRDRLEQLRYDEEIEGGHRNYQERLMDLFDYRDWHEFKIEISMPRHTDGQTTTKGSLSGGERSVALHLPLFAVLAAHYSSASAAPRLIILDELFVGIDPGNQRQLLTVMKELDLDAVVTSDSVWLAVAEVPGVAIHEVQADDPEAGVTTVRFSWDGHDLVADETASQPTLIDA